MDSSPCGGARRRRQAYVLSGIDSLTEQKAFRVRMKLEGVVQACGSGFCDIPVLELRSDVEMLGLSVVNAAPPTSILANGIGEVDPEDGLLEIICFAPRSIGAGISLFWELLVAGMLGRRVARLDIFGWRARKAEIYCSPSQELVVDGEMVGTTPVIFEAVPGRSLTVIGGGELATLTPF